jgi:MFS family permease
MEREAAVAAAPVAPSVVHSIIAARAVRDFGDGLVAVLLPVYLLSLGFGAVEVGMVATSALLGSALLTLGTGWVGGRIDPRRLLLGAALLMTATGVAFALAPPILLLLLALAFLGTINPSSGSVSIFAPIEQTLLSGAVPDRQRTHAMARYGLYGSLAAACGALAAVLPELLQRAGFTQTTSLRAMFVFYAGLGLLVGIAYLRLPVRRMDTAAPQHAPLGPSRSIVLKLAGLFAIDSFAGGLVVQSILALWLFKTYDLSLAAAAAFFFWTSVLSAFSLPVAAWLAERIGLINTMVFTHIPSSLCLIAAAFAPSLEVAIGLLLVRAALMQMDVPTRNSYVMAVVTPAERPAAASVTAVPRGLAAAVAPALAGGLMAAGHTVWPLVLCGVVKIAYDLVLLAMFRAVRPPEELRVASR